MNFKEYAGLKIIFILFSILSGIILRKAIIVLFNCSFCRNNIENATVASLIKLFKKIVRISQGFQIRASNATNIKLPKISHRDNILLKKRLVIKKDAIWNGRANFAGKLILFKSCFKVSPVIISTVMYLALKLPCCVSLPYVVL